MEIISNLVEAHIFRETKNGLEFLLLKRAEGEIFPGLWQMVTGKVKKAERAFEAATREIAEETGLRPQKFWAAPNVNSFYSKEADCISMIPVFAALVKQDAAVKISVEHSEYRWVSPDEAKKLLAWPGQRKSVDIIESYYLREEDFLNLVEIMV